MKPKFLIVAVVAALFAVSAAIAAPPPGKGKPRTGEGCKPKVTVVLKGTFGSLSASSLNMNVTGGNRWGRAYATAGSASVTLDEKTKVRGSGMRTLGDLAELEAGDRVLVQARTCKEDLKNDAKPALTASKVVAHPAKAEDDD